MADKPDVAFDEQEKLQLREIQRMMRSDGWTYLMAAWFQMRETKILGRMKAARTEMPWRYQQGRLDGFDEAVNLAEKLVGALAETEPIKTPEQEAQEIINSLP
jgi:hypothetical protein